MEAHQKTPQLPRYENRNDREHIEQTLRELGHDPTGQSIAVLPAFDRPLEKVRDQKKRTLAQRLERFATELRNDPREPTSLAPENLASPSPVVIHACAACQGYCCNSGGEHAHLTQQTLARVLANNNDLSLEDIVRVYLEKLPAQHYKGSCLYHTDKGCHLPRHLRSDTCNHFHCTGVYPLSILEAGATQRPVIVAATKREKVVRLVVIQDNDAKRLFGK